MFERLRQAIDAMLDSAMPAGADRDAAGRMHEAVVEARAALDEMRKQLAKSEHRLAREQQQLEDAVRRGGLAEGIGDRETVEVAEQFAAKHRERAAVLTRKIEAQRAELALAEREVIQMRDQLKRVRREQPLGAEASERIESAWRDIERAGGTRPGTDYKDDLLRSQMDAAEKEARAAAQLRQLKKKMGR